MSAKKLENFSENESRQKVPLKKDTDPLDRKKMNGVFKLNYFDTN